MFNFPILRRNLYPCYKLYMKMIGVPMHLPYHYEGQRASDKIKEALLNDKPCMVCRYGSLELQIIVAYLNSTTSRNIFPKLSFLMKGEPLTYNKVLRQRFKYMAGFFSADEDKHLNRFAEMMLEDSKLIDIIGVWRTEQAKIAGYFPQATNVPLGTLEPFLENAPWSKALQGKKVLVVHPFVNTIKKQYAKRELLFFNKDVLPEFDLKTLKAVQSAAGTKVEYETWFDALKYMCNEIDKIDYDIALIGAGAYGFPIAAHIKRTGKKAGSYGGGIATVIWNKG